MQLIPYLNFKGQCREALGFYSIALRGEITALSTYGDSPMAGDMPPDSHDQVMHSQLTVAGNTVLMAADGPPSAPSPAPDVCLNVMVDEPGEAERIFQALAEGGSVDMPIEETFWAHRFGTLRDRYGKAWMVNCLKPY